MRRASILLGLGVAAAGCGADDTSPYFGASSRAGKDIATFYLNNGAEPEFLDPGKSADGVSTALIVQMFEGLTKPDPRDGHPVQGVATHWEQSDDHRLFRFHLRPDARWSDGKQVTAGDFEYAWKRALRPATASRSVSNLYALKNGERFHKGQLADEAEIGVRAVDDLTLLVELERATPYFTELTSYPTLFPVRRDVVEPFEQRKQADLWYRAGNIVTNGPYTLDEWRFRDQITMKKSPHYWNRDKLKIHKIVWLSVEQHHATMNLYKAGEIDTIGDNSSLPAEYQEKLQTKRDYLRSDYLSVYWYELNTRRPPLTDVRVRRALNLALDKRQIVERVMRSGQRPATHYVPDFTGGGYAEQAAEDAARGADPFAGPEVEYNPELGRALMKEAGYPVVNEDGGYRANGCPAIEILYNHNEGNRLIAVAVQQMWKRELGISAQLRSEEWKVMLKSYQDGQFQVIRAGWTAEYNHPLTFLEQFRSGSPQNQTGWADPAYEEALKRAMETRDRRESARRYREAEAILVRAMPRIPFYFYTRSTLKKPWVKGFSGLPRGPHLVEFLWIDPSGAAPDTAPAFAPLEFPTPGAFTP